MTFRAKLISGVGVALVLLTIIGVYSYRRTLERDADDLWVAHTHSVVEKIGDVLLDLDSVGSAQRNYLGNADAASRAAFNQASERVEDDLNSLQELLLDNQVQLERLQVLRQRIEERQKRLQDEMRVRDERGTDAALSPELRSVAGKALDSIRQQISIMRRTEQLLLVIRGETADRSSRIMKRVLLVGYTVAFLLLLFSGLLVYSEIVRRTTAEGVLAQRTLELESANKELEAFSYSVSHDLRAPLRSIDGFSQALLEDYSDKLDDAGKDSLNRVRAAAQRMGVLIDDLLKLSRVTRADFLRERVDLTSLAQSVASELRTSDPGRAVDISIAPMLEAQGDPRLLRIVLENLLSNALKFSSKRDLAHIEVGSAPRDGHKAYYVRDDGAGFEPKYSNRLFGAFQRLHRTDEFPGTGVGLATVQRIVNRHGGRIWAESAVGQGATFYFTL